MWVEDGPWGQKPASDVASEGLCVTPRQQKEDKEDGKAASVVSSSRRRQPGTDDTQMALEQAEAVHLDLDDDLRNPKQVWTAQQCVRAIIKAAIADFKVHPE